MLPFFIYPKKNTMEKVGVSGWYSAKEEKNEPTQRKPFEKHPLTLEDGGYVLDITRRTKNGTATKPQKNVKYPMQYMTAVIEKNPNLVEISHDGVTLWHCDSPRAIKHLENWNTRNQGS